MPSLDICYYFCASSFTAVFLYTWDKLQNTGVR